MIIKVSRLSPFPQVSRQLKEWLIFELHETMRVPYIVACPIVFLLFYEEGFMKNDHVLVFLAV